MDLQGENRILVKEGLARLPFTKNKGLKALIRAIGLEDQKITSYDIGFRLGPCINASGRLDTAKRSLELLLERDEVKASALAGELVELNESRKYMTQQETQKALEQIEKDDNQFQRISYYFDIIETLLLLKEYEEAEKIAQKAEVVLRGMNIPGKWVMLAEYEIQIYEKLGDSQKAGRAYEMYYKKDVQQSENRKQTEVKRLKKRIELQKEINKRADIEARKIMLVSQS